MLHRFRPRSAYDVMAAMAFFIAVAGGSAYAAATIGAGDIRKDAVHSRHIDDGAVKSADVGANSVGGGKVIANSLTGSDINESSLATVPNAARLGGTDASQLRAVRIHEAMSGGTGNWVQLFPGLRYQFWVAPGYVLMKFVTNAGGTANIMEVGSSGTSDHCGIQPATIEFAIGPEARVQGAAIQSEFNVAMCEKTPSSQGEARLLIDAGGKTYNAYLHLYQSGSGTASYGEVSGTVTLADHVGRIVQPGRK